MTVKLPPPAPRQRLDWVGTYCTSTLGYAICDPLRLANERENDFLSAAVLAALSRDYEYSYSSAGPGRFSPVAPAVFYLPLLMWRCEKLSHSFIRGLNGV